MSWTVGMAAEFFQQLADRTVIGNWIGPRLRGPKPVTTVLLAVEYASQIKFRLDALLLNIVESVVIALPDIKASPLDGRALQASVGPE